MTPTKATQRLFKYPPMERQDLNQSQLGSFKFIPVDPVNNIQSLTRSAKRFLELQLSQRQRLPGAISTSNAPWQDNASTLSSERHGPHLNPFAADTDFFNRHIKPDLGDSRLRLGPAALRSAVDGAVSPTKKATAIPVQQEPDFNMYYHRASNSMNDPQVVSPQLRATATHPRMPSIDTYMSLSGVGSPGVSDSASFSETLCTALSNEHRAHNATRTALTQQITRCAELEDQLNLSKQRIASMSATIKSLGAIVKHNASKQNSEDATSYNSAEHSNELEEAALKEFYREYNRLKNAAKEREEQKGEGLVGAQERSTKRDAGGEVAATAANRSIDDAYLYNLDLLQKPDPDNTVDSVLRRTLRKHFSIESSVDDSDVPATPSKQRGSINRLVDISPESIDGIKNMEIMRPNVQNGTGGLTCTHIRLLSATDPMVNSSEEVVAKYGHKSVPAALKEQSNGADLTMQHLVKLEALRLRDGAVQPPQDENYGRLGAVSSSYEEDGQSTTAVVSSANTQAKDRIVLQIGSNLHGEPKWLINKDNPIFEDEQNKWECVGCSGPAFRNNSCFFDHPVRYLPEDAAGTVDAYRTVMIDGIPAGTTMMDVLAIVRGGSLESIQLFPPIGDANPSMTARIVFNYEQAAHEMIKNQETKAGQESGTNQFRIKNIAVRCWMPTDPTYPRNPETEHEIFGDAHASRIILLQGVDEYVYNQIPYKLRAIKPGCDQHVIEYSYTDSGWVSIEFSDVKTAIKAFKALRKDPDLWNTLMEYDDDYTCASYVQGGPMGK